MAREEQKLLFITISDSQTRVRNFLHLGLVYL